jgi:ketosteroid isomerase-like protein
VNAPDLVALASGLVARHEIADVLASYCELIDAYDIDAVADLFTQDCETDYGPGRGGPVNGRPAVHARIAAGQAEFRRTHHQLGQIRTVIDGTQAESVSYVTAWHERWDGGRAEVRLRYVDTLRLENDGWRIARRRVEVAGAVGFDGVEWNWIPRRVP